MHLTALGIPPDLLLASGVGPVFLEERIRYHRELRLGDEVTVTCELLFEDTPRRTFRVRQQFLVADDSIAAELGSVCGLLDLDQRRLLEDPRAHLESLTRPPIATRGTT
jgi:acyl-CoA thioester hydrolase